MWNKLFFVWFLTALKTWLNCFIQDQSKDYYYTSSYQRLGEKSLSEKSLLGKIDSSFISFDGSFAVDRLLPAQKFSQCCDALK